MIKIRDRLRHIFSVKAQFSSIKFKFILTTIICLVTVMVIGVGNLNLLQMAAFKKEARNRSELVLNFGESSRKYVIHQLAPAVEMHTKDMIFEAKSNAFVARSIFEIFNRKFPEYIYGQPSLNPLNLWDQADEIEAKIIAQFKANPAIKELSGYKRKKDQELFYVAQPIMVEPSCLKCHGLPEVAPREVVEKYGTTHGYHWQVGDIISALMIYVPTKDIRADQASMIQTVLVTFICLTLILSGLIYVLFDKLVSQRIWRVSQSMRQAALNPGLTVRIDDTATDEIGDMAKVFNYMADSLDDLYTNLEAKVAERTAELEQTLEELKITQAQLIQTEKMSSLGQLVAGIAHEINNPVSFIGGNVNYIAAYVEHLVKLIELFQQDYPHPSSKIQQRFEQIDWEFMAQDLPKLFNSMKAGSDRIAQIVLTLRNFARSDEAEMKSVNIHEGIDSALVILGHRLQGIEVTKEYGQLPLIQCYPGQLNQVFMNLLTNAIDALVWPMRQASPQILIRTRKPDLNSIIVEIADNGGGMTEKVKTQIFNPFFTTKPVGQGKGLGLSISYQIIVDRHQGSIWCESQPNEGAKFYIQIPVQQIDIFDN